MQNITLIGAGSDLGVHVNGASLGPMIILNNFKERKILLEQKKDIVKSQDKLDLKKNFTELNQFNQELYNIIKKENNFCLTVGGDHSISIASGLASLAKNNDLGIIWIDAHLDYNTFQTTITGNLHGLPLAALNGLNQELSSFHNGPYYNPKKTVVIGYRAFEENQDAELENIKNMGVTVYTTNDLKEYGVNKILKEAFKLVGNQIHISFDLDVIEPNLATGVSIPEINGINMLDIKEILDFLKEKKDLIKSFDLVEYNPLNDKENKTLQIATNIIKEIINF